MAQATIMESDSTRGARAGEHSEGMVAKMIEEQTAKLPSDLFCGRPGARLLDPCCFS